MVSFRTSKMRSLAILLIIAVGVCGTAEFDDYEEEVPSTHVPQLLSTSKTIKATIGDAVTFPCEVEDLGDYVILWQQPIPNSQHRILLAGGMPVTPDKRFEIFEKSSLRITSVLPKDSGQFICGISTMPPIELYHNLQVLYPPSIKSRPRDGIVTVKEGETVTLHCDATGNPAPTISWKRAGRNYDNTEGTDFRINSAQKSDSGEYECIADNKIGEAASAVITVEVVSAPKVFPNPRSGLLEVKEGEPISISCEATGDPKPVITWKMPGGDKAQKLRDNSKIMISEADRTHAGSYECIANNSLGIFTSAIIRVQVQYPPEVKVPHAWIHSGEGHSVNLSCIVRGEPTPSVVWKRSDGSIIIPNDHYQLKMSGHLHMLNIDDLTKDDMGRYECVASNPLSSFTESVHVIGTPQVPVFTSKPHSAQATRYTVSWTVKSYTPVDEYSVMYRKKSSSVNWVTKTIPATAPDAEGLHTQMSQLTELAPSTTYQVMVTAKNKFGWSKQNDPLDFTTKSEDKSYQAGISDDGTRPAVSFPLIASLTYILCYRHLH